MNDTIPETERGPTAKAVLSLVRQDGRILAIRMGDFWTLPGALMQPGEPEEEVRKHGLLQCVGANSGDAVKVYEGPNTIVYVASAQAADGAYANYPFAWYTEAEFLTLCVPQQQLLFRAVFAAVRRIVVNQSALVTKAKDSRQLYAIAYEQFCRDDGSPVLDVLSAPVADPGSWHLREPHHVHAVSAEKAREQFLMAVSKEDGHIRILGIALAIGWRAGEEEGVLYG